MSENDLQDNDGSEYLVPGIVSSPDPNKFVLKLSELEFELGAALSEK
jgi:hypothetical protein